MDKDFNLKVTVRNGRLLRLIRRDYETVAAFCRAFGLHQQKVNSMVNFKEAPVNKSGWTALAEDVATALGVLPSEIWPEHLQNVRIKQATAEMDLSADDVRQVIGGDDPVSQIEYRDMIAKLGAGLPERMKGFLEWRLGDGQNATYDECGEYLGGVTRERARQVEMKMFRKMREKGGRIGVRGLH